MKKYDERQIKSEENQYTSKLDALADEDKMSDVDPLEYVESVVLPEGRKMIKSEEPASMFLFWFFPPLQITQ